MHTSSTFVLPRPTRDFDFIASTTCPVLPCKADKPSGQPVCDRCFERLPEGTRFLFRGRTGMRGGQLFQGLSGGALFRVMVRRLGCHYAPQLTVAEIELADSILPRFHSYHSVMELAGAPGGYFPKWSVTDLASADVPPVLLIADVYDRVQIGRGDPRRAIRLGWCGL